jgi:hypothetical protein
VKSTSYLVAGMLLVCGFLGCGPAGTRTGVTGKVLLDGKPLAGAQIQLLSQGDAAQGMHSGTTDEQGQFTINEAAGSNNPIQPGSYVVLVSKYAKAEDPKAAGDAMGGMINVVPAIYLDRGTSPLKIEVKSAQTQAPQLELTSADAGSEKK